MSYFLKEFGDYGGKHLALCYTARDFRHHNPYQQVSIMNSWPKGFTSN